MTHPGVAFMVVVGVGLGALLYYMFGDSNNNEHGDYQHGNQGGGPPPRSESLTPWRNEQDPSKRKRGSCASSDNSNCTICFIELGDNICIQLFPCQHIFHRICITKWRDQGPRETCNTCPNCRMEIIRMAVR